MQHRLVDRPDLQFDGACIAEFLYQRNLIPLKAWRPHVHGEQTISTLPAVENAGGGFKSERILAALFRHQISDTAHTVATGAGFRTVIIVDADKCVGAGRAWW